MNHCLRWTAVAASLAAFGVLLPPAAAFTDENADLKAASADRGLRVVVTGKAGLPQRTVWVPVAPKALDGFKPVLPEDRLAQAGQPQRLASAAPAASARR